MTTNQPADAVRAFLGQHLIGLQPTAGLDSLRFNLKCMAGLHVIVDEESSEPAQYILTGEGAAPVIAMANSGDRVAHEALCEIAAELVGRGEVLPADLGTYIVEAAKQKTPGKRGRHPKEHIWRDFLICKAIAATGLKPTKNEATDGDCGVSIVSAVLREFDIELSDARVLKIWKERHPNWVR